MPSHLLTIVSEYAGPPRDMLTPHGAESVVTITLGAVVAAMVVAALIHWRRTGSPAFLLVLAGGYVCSFNEALVDVLGHCYFPADGHIVYTAFRQPVPVWVALGYVAFFGGLPYLLVMWLKNGASRRSVWLGVGVFWVLDVLLEMPVLASRVYIYYGDQPFAVGGFPLIWLTINGLGALLGAVVITRLSWFFTGVRQLLLVFVPFVTYMSSWVVTMPFFAVNNTDASATVRAAAAILSMILGLIAIDLLIRIGTGQWRLLPPDAPAPVPVPADGA
jgi:hypothetical protein